MSFSDLQETHALSETEPIYRQESNYDTNLYHMSLEEYVLSHFKMRQCNRYVQDTKTSSNICGCGETRAWHEERNLPDDSDSIGRWNSQTCTTTHPTNAFGKCEMLGYSGCGSMPKNRFLRTDSLNTDMGVLQYFMKNYWKLPFPQLIISIIGGTKKMEKCDDKLLNNIKRGLYKTSTSLRTWIITTGIYDGVSRLIGQAVHDRPVEARMEKDDFIVIGVMPWGTVCNSSKLINKQTRDGSNILEHRYFNEFGGIKKGEVIIDPNHTHLLLVDDGTVRKYNTEVQFRKQFETFRTRDHRLIGDCPTVRLHLLIEGGHAALPALESELEENSPIIIVKHSGRCADLVCNMLTRTDVDTSEEEIENLLEDELVTNFTKWIMDEKMRKQCLQTLIKVIRSERKNFYIFDYQDEENEELDKFILQVIFRHHSQLSIPDKMMLAMKMRRCDLAKEEVFSYDSKRKELKLNDCMTKALKCDMPDFIELLLSEGLVIENYLTADLLYSLYFEKLPRKVPANKFLMRMMEATVGFFRQKNRFRKGEKMEIIGKLISRLTKELLPQFYQASDFPDVSTHGKSSVYQTTLGFSDTSNMDVHDCASDIIPLDELNQSQTNVTFPPRCKDGQRIFTSFDLFLWAVLHNRLELAKIFWRVGKDQVSSALVASAILQRLRTLAVNEGEVNLASRYEESSQLFEVFALELLSIAYTFGKKRTHLLLCRSLPYCDENTCLFMAYQFGSMAFLHHPACQTRLSRIWMGAMPSSVSLTLVLLNIPLAIFTIRSLFPAEEVMVEDSSTTTKPVVHSGATEQKKQRKKKKDSSKLVELSQSNKGQSYLSALYLFYTAPITKFAIYVVSYCLFLFILTYFVLIELEPINSISKITVWEYLTWIWCIDIIVEEGRQISDEMQSSYWSKIRYWISGTGSSWNKYDLSAILLFLLSVILRFTVPAPQFTYVRVSYGLMIVLFYIRFLQFYFSHRRIGPKVIIINKMFNDLFFFLCIYFVFIFAYGSFIQAILYPNKEPSISILRDIVRFPFWQTFGDLNLEYYKGNTTCTPGARGCGVQSPLVELAGGVYILSVNILLINLLIAIFGHTFSTVHETSEKVWAFYRFGLIQEFQERPPLPPPFMVFGLIIMYLLRRCQLWCKWGKPASNPFRFELKPRLDRKIALFEDNCAHMYHAQEEAADENLLNYRMKVILQQLQQLRDPNITNITTFDPSRNNKMSGEDKIFPDIHSTMHPSREGEDQLITNDEKLE